jgi:formate dehydrogenase major subunit
LDLSQRGALTMLSAGMNVSLAESSCISCGTCLDVCPTGSLVDKRSAFIARDIDTEHIRSICSQCSLGCGLDIVVRDEKILRIQGQWDAPVNHGLLCQKGRFDPFYEDRQRILQPLLRQGSMEIVVSWDHALKQVSEKIGKITPQKLGVLTTTQATNEALYLIKKLFMRELKVNYLGLLNQVVPKLSTHTVSSLVDISISDCILIVGSDPVNTHPVASFSVKRTVDKGTQLIVVNSQETSLASYADRTFMLSEIEQAIKIVNRAEQPVVLYSTGATKQTCKALAKLKSKATFLALQPGVNTQAEVAYGLNKIFNPSAIEVAYIVAGEQNDNFGEIIEKFQKDTFIIVQASYHTALTQRADVVLPMSTWLECSGTLTNTWGLVQDVHMAISPPGRSKMDWQILFLLAKKLEKEWSVSLAEISGNTALQF